MKVQQWIVLILVSCSSSKEDRSSESQTDSVSLAATNDSRTEINSNTDYFVGEYLIGEGTWDITPIHMAFEMRSSPQAEPQILFYKGIESDTVTVYELEDKSAIFKMYPGHNEGMYYEDDEQWPVSRLNVWEGADESEQEEQASLDEENLEDEAVALNEISIYSGEYSIYTESEGAVGILKLNYKKDRVFAFELSLDVPEICSGVVKGDFKLENSQKGAFASEDCKLFIYFKGSGPEGYIVEVDQPGSCIFLSEDCIFGGIYVSQH